MYRHLIVFILGVLIFAAPGRAIAGQPFVLGSGKTIQIQGLGPINFTNGETALALKFQTLTPLKDLDTLTKEVNEIWDRFIVDVEKGGYKSAIVFAQEPLSGSIVRSGVSYNFVFLKQGSAWRMLEPGKPQRLSKESVTAFSYRRDWLATHKAVNAIFLYLPDDYTFTASGQVAGPAPVILNRLQYAAAVKRAFAAVTSYQVRRDILDIVLLKGGTKARLESREFETVKIAGKSILTITRLTEMLELRDGSLQVLRSTAIIENDVVAGQP